MKKVIQVEKGSSILGAVITCYSKGSMFQYDHSYWKIVDAKPRSDNFVDIVLESAF